MAGSVARPGLYELKGTNDTVLDVLDQAGGPAKDAAQHVLLIPAEVASPLHGPATRRAGGTRVRSGRDAQPR